MSRKSSSSAITTIFRGCMLFCMGACLLFSLTPLTDFDFDGESDSFVTEQLLVTACLPAVVISALLSSRFTGGLLTPPKLFSAPIVPPPIL